MFRMGSYVLTAVGVIWYESDRYLTDFTYDADFAIFYLTLFWGMMRLPEFFLAKL